MKTTASRNRAVRRKRITCKYITEYMRMVETGQVESCEEQKKLVAHVRKTFAEEPLIIDYGRLDKCAEFQQYFPFDLFPWEWFVFALAMCVFKPDGTPRWSEILILVGRGAGKNALLSFFAFCAMSKTNGVENYNIDICANSEKQAVTTFKDIYRIVSKAKHAKIFKNRFKWNKTEISSISTGSEVHYHTANADTKDGLRPGMVMFDEVHQYEDYENLDVYTTALGKTDAPRIVYTTTNGYVRDGVLDDLIKRAEQILNGEIEDNGFLPFICKIDSKDEVYDEAKWEKANPSLPYLPNLLTEIKREFEAFKINPVKSRGFLTKRMNWPTSNVDLEAFNWDDIMKTNREMPDLTGKPCVCGIDFAQNTDFLSAFLLFRVDGKYYGIHHSWFCANSKDADRIKIKGKIPMLEAKGVLKVVEDFDIPASSVTDWIVEQSMRYDIQAVSLDLYRYKLIERELNDIGYSREAGNINITRPSDIMMYQPKINSMFVRGNIVWGDDPLMRWFTNNVKLEVAQNNNFKYGKIEEKSRKTDGFMAFVHAMCDEGAIPEEIDAVIYEPLVF